MAARDDHETHADIGFAAFFRENTVLLCRYVQRLVTSSAVAEEISQEAFTRTFVALGKQHPAPRQFLFTTARNLALDHLRHSRTAATDLAGDALELISPPDESPSAERALLSKQQLALLRVALDELPLATRAIVTMRCLEGQSIAAITQRLRMSETSVRKYLARGMLHCQVRVGWGDIENIDGDHL
jgi:RNA polymerase sigma-70 factor (ECF subfamily)